MSAVIKSDASPNVSAFRPLGSMAARASEPRIDPEIAALRSEVERLTAALADRDSDIAGHGAALHNARLEGEAAGREIGLAEAEDGHEALIAALKTASDIALDDLRTTLATLERLAPELAIASLERILGPSADRSGLVADLVGAQLKALKDQTVVTVEVSRYDFHGDGRDALVAALGRPGLKVEALPTLQPGECRLVLRLGAVEIGLDQQWNRLRELLADLAEPGAAA